MSAWPANAVSAGSLLPLSPLKLPEAVHDFPAKRAALLKHIARSERLTDIRPASRLEVRPTPEMLSSGVAEVDALVGGIPRGCLTGIYGAFSSGKTSLLLATMTAATRQGESCVLIDASDSFDPASARTAGMDFRKLLWVRCGGSTSHAGCRPSSAKPGISLAYDLRRTTYDDFAEDRRLIPDASKPFRKTHEARLEQVLKAADLVLQSGGFGLIVLDLAGVSEKFVRRIPLASWFRFQRAVEHTKSALLVVSEPPCAQTCATLTLKVSNQRSGGTPEPPPYSSRRFYVLNATPLEGANAPLCHAHIQKGIHIAVELMRSRLERKPMQSVKTSFAAQAVRFG